MQITEKTPQLEKVDFTLTGLLKSYFKVVWTFFENALETCFLWLVMASPALTLNLSLRAGEGLQSSSLSTFLGEGAGDEDKPLSNCLKCCLINSLQIFGAY